MELLIVVVVIAILAAIAVVSYNGIRNRANESAAQATARQAFGKIQTYAATNSDSYPGDLATAGLRDSAETTYQYRVNNGASPRTFCLTATTRGVSYHVSNAVYAPKAGGCPAGPSTPAYYQDFESGTSAFTAYLLNENAWSVSGAGAFTGSAGLAQSSATNSPRIRYDPSRSFAGPTFIEGMVRIDGTTALPGLSLVSTTTQDSIQVLLDDRSSGAALRIRENYLTGPGTTESALRGYSGMVGTWFRLRLELNGSAVSAYMYDVNGTELARATRNTGLQMGDVHPGVNANRSASFDNIEAGALAP